MFDKIFGHKEIIEYFKLIYKSKRLSSSYLFIGKESIGKKKVARFIAAFFNCQKKNTPCGQCQSCKQIQSGTHPDTLEICPENSIGIDAIRQVQSKVYLKSYSSAYKIIIIDNADKLTLDAANAFLKTLEEPPENVIFILISAKPSNLPPTILSRTQKIWFSLKFDDIKEYLVSKDIRKQAINFLLQASEGKLSTIENLQSKDYIAKRKALFSAPKMFLSESNRNNLKSALFNLICFLRDCLVLRAGCESVIINSDLRNRITEYEGQFEIEELISKISYLFTINETLDNININLANNLVNSLL